LVPESSRESFVSDRHDLLYFCLLGHEGLLDFFHEVILDTDLHGFSLVAPSLEGAHLAVELVEHFFAHLEHLLLAVEGRLESGVLLVAVKQLGLVPRKQVEGFE